MRAFDLYSSTFLAVDEANCDISKASAIGQKYSNTIDFTYYSVEPGIAAPIGYGLTAKVGYRFRSAFDSSQNNDQTHTMRYSLAYALNAKDSVALKYDRVNGDNNQKIVAIAYTMGF